VGLGVDVGVGCEPTVVVGLGDGWSEGLHAASPMTTHVATPTIAARGRRSP
jgi:hypothetical protein